MHLIENNDRSNCYIAETSPGSGRLTLWFKDATEFYRGLTYGFCLDIPDEWPEHLLDIVKPHLKYADFAYGKEVAVRDAIGLVPWMALSPADKWFLAQCKLVKVGEAHIQMPKRK